MKKIFTSMLAFVAALGMTATAGEYMKCYVNGEEVNSGDRINITDFYEEKGADIGDGTIYIFARQYNTHLVVVPQVVDLMMATIDYNVNETPLSADGQFGADMAVQFCGFGSCVNTNFGETKEFVTASEVESDEEIDMQTEFMVTAFGTAASCNELRLIDEFTMTLQMDDEEIVLTFYIDQAGVDAAVEGIEAESNAAPVYYDLQGRMIENPSKGLYIVKKGNTVTKEFVK